MSRDVTLVTYAGLPELRAAIAAFLIVAILDIVKWIEDERKRKKTGKAGPGSD